MTNSTARKQGGDKQITGLAGEFFVAAELLKLGLQTSLTFGTAKDIDLQAYNPNSGKKFTIQVKALREKNYFPLGHEKVKQEHIYVFVVLNKPGQPVQYFIVPGETLHDAPDKFGEGFRWDVRPGVHPRSLAEFENQWRLFLQ